MPDPRSATDATQQDNEDLPNDALVYLLGSRYVETDVLTNSAWELPEAAKPGWRRVKAILDYVHGHIRFDYMQADSSRSAMSAYLQRVAVRRDFTHLAIAFCRCMNIPARYCTGYLGDIGKSSPAMP